MPDLNQTNQIPPGTLTGTWVSYSPAFKPKRLGFLSFLSFFSYNLRPNASDPALLPSFCVDEGVPLSTCNKVPV